MSIDSIYPYESLFTRTHTHQDSLPLAHWQGCPMLVQCLLSHCKHHHEDIDTLFQLLRVYMTRHLTSYHFLTSYIENDVTKGYSIEQKRAVFFKLVEVFGNQDYPQELKAKVSIQGWPVKVREPLPT